ncbi:hypothetical protein UFOVP309_40 [uncultured Caudovirales phage]|uniref:Uncharacterized protein n=1 Tax=uncultured Caudovirales phage TaxID=2100421 RepID=A0A6J5Q1A9_9CAUD|nr:hypothetical protein UFOVP309_40 [uncultured Caudovirales phage]CAB4173364.1 hypothetical protein UFOVP946_47 [uncultured Caudovirales phage]
MGICTLIKMLILQDGYYRTTMINKYKPKQSNINKLEIFLKKIENKIQNKDGIKFSKH